MKNIYLFSILFILASCGGGGGGGGSPLVPFAISIGLNSFTVDEDSSFNGSLDVTANEQSTFTYSIKTSTTNGTLNLNAAGTISYSPRSNFNGTDQFTISVTSVEKNITKDGTINITINPVNDAPTISLPNAISFSKETILFDDNQTFRITVDDIDNELEQLSFEAILGQESLAATFTPDADYATSTRGVLSLDLSGLQTAGLYEAQLSVSDGNNSSSLSFESWFVSNKTTVTIQQDDDPEDGFDGGDKTPKDYLVYYLSGSPSSLARTKYLFIGDSLDGQSDINLYRRALTASVNKLNDSDASAFFNEDFFTIVSAEPINPDGTSPVGVRTDCYDWDETIYCIGDMDTDIFEVLLPDYVLVSTLTKVQGRGVNLGSRNIQRIRDSDPEATSNTLMHELGHAHGYMGDEYRTDDDRDVSAYADDNVNTTTQSDVSLLKWNHHIDDLMNVLGMDIKVCYNTSSGAIYDRDAGEYIDGSDCGCLANEWDSNGNFIRKNPECSKVGLFEGNYYGEFDNYRPTFCSIMDSCNEGGYGKVNVEGFAVGSIQNQGFYDSFYDAGYSNEPNNNDFGFTTDGDGWKMTVQADYDTSKITLKWYINGTEQPSLENQRSVTFSRPANNEVQVYTAKAIDLTGTIIATDDVLDNTDFYEGIFQSYFIWCADYDGSNCNDWRYDPDSSQYSQFDYGYMDGPLGFSWGINWAKW
jgi:VCBS repeat-containing protein